MRLRTRGIDDVGVEQIIWSAGSEAELQRIEQRLRTHSPSTYTNTLNGSLSSTASTQIRIAC